MVARMVELTLEYGRYGYRRVAALPRSEGFTVDHKRVERLRRQEGLKVPQEQPKRGRLWLGDGSCVQPRPQRKDHAWSCDFAHAMTRDGRAFRMLNIIDEFTAGVPGDRRGPSVDRRRRIGGGSPGLFERRGVPEHIRSDNGPEFTAKAVREWPGRAGVGTLFVGPGSPWEDGYVESFNGKLSDELLDGEVFDAILEAKVLIERYRVHDNTVRPHSSLGYRPPAPEAIMP